MVRPVHRTLAVVALTLWALGSIAAGVQFATHGRQDTGRGRPAQLVSRAAVQVAAPGSLRDAAFASLLVPAATGRPDIVPVSAPGPQSVPAPGPVAEPPSPPAPTPPSEDPSIIPALPVPVPEALEPVTDELEDTVDDTVGVIGSTTGLGGVVGPLDAPDATAGGLPLISLL